MFVSVSISGEKISPVTVRTCVICLIPFHCGRIIRERDILYSNQGPIQGIVTTMIVTIYNIKIK